jgi:hypothetical protein
VPDPEPAPALAEHYFRHEFGRLVSVLSRRFGVHRVELCEDAVQTALLRAVQTKGGMARPIGFEPTTCSFGGCHSIQLSYGRVSLILQEIPNQR